MQCEICGSETELVEAIVEGVIMKICNNCAKYGNVIPIENTKLVSHLPVIIKHIKTEEEIDFVVNNYSELIQKARERKRMRQDELAKSIGEKESVIHNIESGHLRPNLKLAKKLSVFLNINLIAKEEKFIEEKDIDFKDTNMTIGDILRAKK